VPPNTPLELLASADGAPSLPRLGGMARPDGVVIVSERYWAFAGTDGSLREGDMPKPPALLERLPLVRGLLRLGAALAPLVRRTGVAGRRERPLLLAALLAPFSFVLLPGAYETPLGIAATVGLAAWLLRGATLRLHGAEHRAIAATETRSLVATWHGETRPSRFAARCGTNFAALALPVTFLADRLWPLAPELWTPVAVAAISLAATMELWRAVQSRSALRVLLLPGLGLQRVTTREPRLEETRTALRAAASVLRRELAH
jgi:Protein of unknown function (DUF1385)